MFKDKEKYISHINDSTQILNMRKIIDKIEIVYNTHQVQCTNFLNPYECKLAKSILNRFNQICYIEDGGFINAERKIIILFPDYYYFDLKESPITPLAIDGNLDGLKHSDFLGAILNLGIIREKVGDILIHEDSVHVITDNDVSDFISMNLNKVGNKKIIVKHINREGIREGKVDFKEVSSTLTSLRLDNIISKAYNISRNDSINIIKNRGVKVNWEPIEKPHFLINEGDLISVRGYGRFILKSILYKTRKDKLKVLIRKII